MSDNTVSKNKRIGKIMFNEHAKLSADQAVKVLESVNFTVVFRSTDYSGDSVLVYKLSEDRATIDDNEARDYGCCVILSEGEVIRPKQDMSRVEAFAECISRILIELVDDENAATNHQNCLEMVLNNSV